MFAHSLSLFLIVFALSLTAHARKVALFMGASGDTTATPTTPFDEGIRDGITYLKESGFETDVLYNGLHQKGRAVIAAASGKTPPSFTAENIEASLSRIENQKFAAGDQVAIVIETHGWDTKQKDGYHCIWMEGQKCWSAGRLEQLKKKLEAQGVQLAILDHSCFSGSTLNLQGPSTCVQTGADYKSFGLIAHGPSFWAAARKNRAEGKPTDLETIFAEARAGEDGMSSPQISTQTNRNLRKLEMQLLDLRKFEKDNPRHSLYIEYKPTADQAELVPQCISEDLPRQIQQLTRALNYTAFNSEPSAEFEKDLSLLSKKIKSYNQLRSQLNDQIQKIERTAIDTVEVNGKKIPLHLFEVLDRFLAKPRRERNVKAYMKEINFDTGDEYLFEHLAQALPDKIAFNKFKNSLEKPQVYDKLRDGTEDYLKDLKNTAIEINGLRNRIFSEAYKQTRLHDDNACSQFKL